MFLLFCLCVYSVLRVACSCCFVCVCIRYLGHMFLLFCLCVYSVLRVTCSCCFVCVCIRYLGSHVLVVLFVCVFGT